MSNGPSVSSFDGPYISDHKRNNDRIPEIDVFGTVQGLSFQTLRTKSYLVTPYPKEYISEFLISPLFFIFFCFVWYFRTDSVDEFN